MTASSTARPVRRERFHPAGTPSPASPQTIPTQRAGQGGRTSAGAGQSGFTLVEILIALLVLSIGLLGLAGLQTAGLRANHSANLRTQATLLAYDMTDRMRANWEGYKEGFYDDPSASENEACLSTGCGPQDMAEHDMWEWGERIAITMPQGAGIVCLDDSADDGDDLASDGCGNNGALNDSIYAVKIWWADEFDTETGDPVTKRFAIGFQP
jgi:type IV pilus assembly protein PilV